ncbi:hypothetical protein WME79_10815 [Sorangium sp. So ce726]|uniref:hypothetical protein n=1 Tax=Sorangium sp. So ce726 TaxID=3133319 RepID=UPI003F647595
MAVGIHTGFADSGESPINRGVRVTQEVADTLTSLIREVECGTSDEWINRYWCDGVKR